MIHDDDENNEIDPALVQAVTESRHREGGRLSQVADTVAMESLRSWENGYQTAVDLARRLGATAIADELEAIMDAYWRSQGVED